MDEAKFWHYRPSILQLALRENLVGLEVGVDKGINAHNILSNLHIKKLYLIDPYFPQSEEFDRDGERPYEKGSYRPAYENAKNILSKFNNIEWLIGTTEEIIDKIPNESLDFGYIDGDHRYEFVKKDIQLCLPKIKNGGTLGGHDFCQDHQGVVRAVLESFNRSELFVGNRDWWIVKNG